MLKRELNIEMSTTNLTYKFGPPTSSWAAICLWLPCSHPASAVAQGVTERIFSWSKGLRYLRLWRPRWWWQCYWGGLQEGCQSLACKNVHHPSLSRNSLCLAILQGSEVDFVKELDELIPCTGCWCPSICMGWHFIINELLSGKPLCAWHQEVLQSVLCSLRDWWEQRWRLVEPPELLSICLSLYKRIPMADKRRVSTVMLSSCTQTFCCCWLQMSQIKT